MENCIGFFFIQHKMTGSAFICESSKRKDLHSDNMLVIKFVNVYAFSFIMGMLGYLPINTGMMEYSYLRSHHKTDLSSLFAAFPLEGCSLLFLTRLHRRLWETNRYGLVWLKTGEKLSNFKIVICKKLLLELSPDAVEPELSMWEELQEQHELLLDRALQSAAAWSRTFCCDTGRRKVLQDLWWNILL